MARGDLTVFEKVADLSGKGAINFATDTLKLGIIDETAAPLVTDADPKWANWEDNDVDAGGGYTANGITLTYGGLDRWEENDGVGTLKAENIELVQDGDGFDDAHWGILYSDTHASKAAFAFVDLGGPVSEKAGPVNINWNASGILTKTVDNT